MCQGARIGDEMKYFQTKREGNRVYLNLIFEKAQMS